VHAECDYYAPLKVGDEVEISIFCGKTGTSSFTLNYHFFCPVRQIDVGKASIVHVTISKETGKSILIPEQILALLQGLLAPAVQV